MVDDIYIAFITLTLAVETHVLNDDFAEIPEKRVEFFLTLVTEIKTYSHAVQVSSVTFFEVVGEWSHDSQNGVSHLA